MANIETITVGNTTYDIVASGYAVSEQYSTDERAIGTWIDGRTIYQKTVIFGALPNNTTKTVDSGLSASGTDVIEFYMIGSGISSNLKQVETIGSVRSITTIGNNHLVLLRSNATSGNYDIIVITKTDLRFFTDTYCTIKYVKTPVSESEE